MVQSSKSETFPEGSPALEKECSASTSPENSLPRGTETSLPCETEKLQDKFRPFSHSQDKVSNDSDKSITSWLSNILKSENSSEKKAPPILPLYYKEFGYRAFSQLIASEQTFFMVRRFGALNARVALCLQDKIAQLADKLDAFDEDNTLVGDVNNGTFREEHDPRRTELIEGELLDNLTKYNNFVNSYSKLVNRPAVRKEARKEVEKWLKVHRDAIHDPEAAYIGMEDDLVAIHPKEKSWFRHILEWTFVFKLPVFRREPRGYNFNTEAKDVVFQNDSRLEKFSSVVIAIIGLAMLIGPLWILDKVQNTEQQLGVITGFIALFFVLVAVATNAKIFESLAAAAAYSAVLMVFLQMGNNRVGGK